jgi:hypothetical protein
MDISLFTVKVIFIVSVALIALVIADARWFGPWRAARRHKLEKK